MLRWWSCKDLLPKRIMLNQLALFISLASDVEILFLKLTHLKWKKHIKRNHSFKRKLEFFYMYIMQ